MAHTSHHDGSVFIHQFELITAPADRRILRVRLEIARQFYNAMLGEAKRRYQRCRMEGQWAQARQLRQTDPKRARMLYEACKKMHGYSEYSLVAQVKTWRQNVFAEHLDFKACQELTVRAFHAHERFLKDRTHRLGKERHVRFKRRGDFDTLSSIGMKIDVACQEVRWWGLRLAYRLSAHDPHGLEAYVLDIMQNPMNIRAHGRRLTRKVIRGEDRWFLQVTLKGVPYHKVKHDYKTNATPIGIDIGPSTLAIATDQGAVLLELAPDCAKDEREVRRLQRYLDRSRRATNPQCYDIQGRCVAKPTTQSQRYRIAAARLADVERRLAAKRKLAHNALVHSILEHGTHIYAEKLSMKAWQRGLFGKSLGKRAPGQFLARLKQQAEQYGGERHDLPTGTLKLSQFCHGCGTYEKKTLSTRTHQCACGVGPIQRDIYSAFLARHYIPEDKSIDVGAARAAFAQLQLGAMDIDAAIKLRGGRLLPSAPSHSGGRKSGSIVEAALAHGEVVGDVHPQKPCPTPHFSGNNLSFRQTPASTEADINPPMDARSSGMNDLPGMRLDEGHKKRPSRGRYSHKTGQLSLFADFAVPSDSSLESP